VAGPDFSRTTIAVVPSAPLEGDVVRYQVTLRNTGDTESIAAQLKLTLPHAGMFVDLAGLDGARVDPASKSIETSVALPAGAERSFAFRVVAPRDAGGHVLSPQVALQDFYSRVSYIDSVTTEIGTRPSTGGLVLGSHRITPAGLIALGFLVAVLALWLIGRLRSHAGPSRDRRGRPVPRILARGTGPLAGALAIVIALGFWTIFASMARRDWRSLAWPETTCTVLDRKLKIETATSGTGGSPATRTTEYFDKLLALRYQAAGVDTISTGFDTGSRLQIGGGANARQELERWAIGATVPCWFDPEDPRDVVVVPGFGGAYLFALFPLPVFLFGVWQLRSRVANRGGR
jgi:type IV secretory pathway VirB2 component (pilin)